ncbi:M24 family metallopeptidase [Alkalicoccobacillus porphyridii]|uniref:M24 family metallopeptidase n=1 Tax=Alkalicoccobacillus porphyridii TaxID=2597270 RepID=A0A554A3N7_9BACI|nr:M24 family metallopeptidase [Alkalicoccobacillus porphyridii]TSB48295.1 M24 family metallopeptidase [Alkalicoccobacillus porphyridii]
MLSFTLEEYQERLGKTKEKMAAAGIDVLLISDPANMNYLSGYDGWSFYVHQMLIVIIDEAQPIWLGRSQDANGAKLTVWMHQDFIIPYPDEYVQSLPKHPMDFVAQILTEIGQSNRAIAVEMDHYYFTAACMEHLKQHLPNASFKDGTNIVNRVRIIKSDQEIEYMKRAGAIVERAMQAGIDAVQTGVRECDVAATIFHAQISGTEAYGGDYPAIVPLMPSGIKTSAPHLTWTDGTYKQGETVILEIAGCYKRYHSPLARTLVVGQPALQVVELSEIVIEGLNETLQFVKPGVTCEEVEAVWRKSIAKHGLEKESRLGYSMGLNYPPDWGEHTASLRQGDKTVIQENMTFHVIPGMWFDSFGVELSESIRVTKTGCETLANFSRELFIKHPTIHSAS